MSVLAAFFKTFLAGLLASTVVSPTGSPAPIALGQPFVVNLGEVVLVEGGLSLAFLAVSEDSRCPADVVCVWEGNAHIVLELQAGEDAPEQLGLDTHPGFTTEATYRTFTVGLVDLAPYPMSSLPMAAPYRATLVVQATPPVTDAPAEVSPPAS